jgi:hypothetical protein
MVLMVRALQLVIHLPIFQIQFPANVILYFSIIIRLVAFDVLDNIWSWQRYQWFNFDYNRALPVHS